MWLSRSYMAMVSMVILYRANFCQGFLWPISYSDVSTQPPYSCIVQVSILLAQDHKYERLETTQQRAGSAILAGFQSAQRQGLLSVKRPAKEGGQQLNFNVTFRDTKCDISYSSKAFIDAMVSGVDVLFGPSCEYALAPVARLIKFYDVPLLTAGGLAFDFTARKSQPEDEFNLLTKTGYSFEFIVKVIFDLFHRFGWQRTKLVYRKNDHSNWSGNNTCTQLMSAVVKVAQERKIVFEEIKLDATDKLYPNDTASMLHKLGDFSVIILCASPSKVRDILLTAEELGFMDRGEYVFFNVELFASKSRIYKPWYVATASEEENLRAKKAYEAVFTVSTTMFAENPVEYEILGNAVRDISLERFKVNYTEPINSFVANFHDAVLLYATALREVIEEFGCHVKSNGSLITSRMWNRTISGITGEVSIDSNGDRRTDYVILDMDPVSGEFQVFAVYSGVDNKFRMMNDSDIHWPGGLTAPPPDRPICGFTGSLCDDANAMVPIIVSTVLSIVVVVLCILLLLIFRHYKLEAELASMTWKIKPEELQCVISHEPRCGSRLSLGKLSHTSNTSFDSIAAGASKRQIFVKTLLYKGSLVAVKKIDKSKFVLQRDLLLELKRLKDLHQDHLVRFIGACIDAPHCCLLTEYCPRGSLQDILEDEDMNLDWNFRSSLTHDIVKGMAYIHNSEIKYHGNLKSSNCVVDSRFVLKLTDFGLHSIRDVHLDDDYSSWRRKLWTAPERLREQQSLTVDKLARCDIYSFAIILQEIVFRQGPFYLGKAEEMEPKEIVERVCERGALVPLRPYVNDSCASEEIVKMMTRCWAEDPLERPDFASLKITIRKLNKENESSNILDTLLSRMEQYANHLESLVEDRTADYLEEKRKCENLLYELLPKSVATQLIRGESVIAETYSSVTIYFSDIVGFTSLSAQSTPLEIVDFLNDLYTCFDSIIGNYDVYKVETIGDAYMVVSGLPVRNGLNHAGEIARMSLKLLEAVQSFRIRHKPREQMKLRIGLHSGPCCAGVVGIKMPRYCLFGDTVNTASRMESNGLPLKIHVSSVTKDILEQLGCFQLEARGLVDMKGKGLMMTYWLLGVDQSPDQSGSKNTDAVQTTDCENATVPLMSLPGDEAGEDDGDIEDAVACESDAFLSSEMAAEQTDKRLSTYSDTLPPPPVANVSLV